MSELVQLENITNKIRESVVGKLGIKEDIFIKECKFALDIWNDPKNEYLRSATKESFYNAIYNIHTIGLTLNPVKKEAYLIPRKKGDNTVVCLEASYQGLIKLLTDAGVIKNIQTNVVYEGCYFDSFFDMNGINFKHTPYHTNGNPKGKIKGVYSLAFLTNNNTQFEYMTKEEIDSIKELSESYKSYTKKKKEGKWAKAIWVDYESEMTRKTILRRIYKYLPKSVGKQSDYIDNAVRLDESAFEATKEQIEFIEALIRTSDLNEDEKIQIENEFVVMTSADAKRQIEILQDRQLPLNETRPLQLSETEVAKMAKQKEIFDNE
jgi:phage RecT family recombinase